MTSKLILVESLNRTPTGRQAFELVERKGKGHPDSICDAVAEEVSQALCREYTSALGRILHYNVDKAMLVAGRSEPRLGGGKIVEPMRLVLGDRASSRYLDKKIDVAGIAEVAVKNRLRKNLRLVDPDQHLLFQNELKEGSPELTGIFDRNLIVANDTSVELAVRAIIEQELAEIHTFCHRIILGEFTVW